MATGTTQYIHERVIAVLLILTSSFVHIQLDDIYVRQQHKVQGTGKRSSLVVPFDVKQSQITGDVLNTVSDERVSDVVKVEYFSKLHKLLQSATQARSASDMAETGAENTALNTVQNASSSLKRDVLCIPELAAAFAKQKKQHVLSQPEWGDRVCECIMCIAWLFITTGSVRCFVSTLMVICVEYCITGEDIEGWRFDHYGHSLHP